MITKVVMPQLGESVFEGTIVKWLKEEGAEIKKDEPLFEVETDKVTTEVPSPAGGVVAKLLVPEGEKVEIGTEIAIIADSMEEVAGEAVAAAAGAEEKTAEPKAEKAVAVKEAEAKPKKKKYSPVAKRLAEEHGIDINLVEGTGVGGRVMKEDVEAYAKEREEKPEEIAPAEPPVEERVAAERKVVDEGKEVVVPLTRMRRAIAEHMVKSKRTSPHVSSIIEVDMTRIVRFREAHREAFEKREGVKLTYLPFIIQATVSALKEQPYVNSTYTDEGIILKKYINLGIAVALDEGLIVPVIKAADEKSIVGLTREVNHLASAARANRLQPDDVQGGTFTITNVGAFGTLMSMPIINQPQAAIMAVDSITKRPVVIDDAIAIRSMVYLCLSYDHRVVDGATAAKFLKKVKEGLEDFPLPPSI